LSTLTLDKKDKTKRGGLDTQRIAWIVLVSFFVVFCLLFAGVSVGVHYFFYRSTIPMLTTVQVSRGSVGLIRTDLSESFELRSRLLSQGEQVITDSQSQAVISLRDGKRNGQLIASVTVKNNAALLVETSLQPRFERGGRDYRVSLRAEDGEFDLFVPSDIPRPVAFSVSTDDGVMIDISQSGRYTLTINQNVVELSTWEGRAAIIPPDRQASRSVVEGQVGTFSPEGNDILLRGAYIDIMNNSRFQEVPIEAFGTTPGTIGALESWNCSDRTANSPIGVFEAVYFDGRDTLRMFRGIGTESHGETTCIQPFGPSGQVGLRVDQFEHLELRTTFYIQNHSLDACGIQGSECPLMLRMDYVDQNGRSNQWFHGFYSKHEARADFPLICVSCQQDHERINMQTWYTYESGNLFSLLPEGSKPASILNVQFYSSGHDYDVYVSELSLLTAPRSDDEAT
jgi:hypothetical protein